MYTYVIYRDTRWTHTHTVRESSLQFRRVVNIESIRWIDIRRIVGRSNVGERNENSIEMNIEVRSENKLRICPIRYSRCDRDRFACRNRCFQMAVGIMALSARDLS